MRNDWDLFSAPVVDEQLRKGRCTHRLAKHEYFFDIGFIGGLTTYSSFNYETMRLFEEGAPATAAVNLALTLIGGFMAGWLGLLAARGVLGR